MPFKNLLKHSFFSFNKCEIIEIFGFDKSTKEVFNIYTLIVFLDTQYRVNEEKMTTKQQVFKGFNTFTWGIKKRIVTIDEASDFFKGLKEKNKFCIDKELNIGKVKILEESYIPPQENMIQEIQLNYILKNNFHNGSYVLEFFDETKKYVRFLLENLEILNSLSEEISEIIPLKIALMPDRLGNIIFQFPINNLNISVSTLNNTITRNFEGIKFDFISQKTHYDIENLFIRTYENNDNIITRQKIINVKKSSTKLLLDDSFGTNIEIFDKKSGLLVYKYKLFIIKRMNLNMGLIEDQKRIFNNNGIVEKISVTHHSKSQIFDKYEIKRHDDWIRDRKKNIPDINSYSLHYHKQREKALSDLRELINTYAETEVYILDPYLSVDDIKNTISYSTNLNINFKLITALESRKLTATNNFCIYCKNKIYNDKLSQLQMIQSMKNKLDNEGFSMMLKLEFRAIFNISEIVHDRYLVINTTDNPRVYNLGTSINSLGNGFHSITRVDNPEKVIEFIKKLWDKLNGEECVIWKNR